MNLMRGLCGVNKSVIVRMRSLFEFIAADRDLPRFKMQGSNLIPRYIFEMSDLFIRVSKKELKRRFKRAYTEISALGKCQRTLENGMSGNCYKLTITRLPLLIKISMKHAELELKMPSLQ